MKPLTNNMTISINPQREQDVLQSVQDAAGEETSWESGFVFNTLCCRPHPVALRAFAEFADRNLLKEQSAAGRRMEREVVSEYSAWFGALEQGGRNGYVCSGGTEGNFVALWSAKSKRPDRRKVILSRYAHYSYDRFALPLGLEMVSTPLDADLNVQLEEYLRSIDEQTLAVVVTAGDPVLGRDDPNVKIVEAARRHGCAVHFDAAYGGYFLPFFDEYSSYFRTALAPASSATTLTLDPHKYGLCPLGTGVVLFADKEDLDRISLSVAFPPIESRTFQGSRSAGPTAAAWAMLRLLGQSGYARLAQDVIAKRVFMTECLSSIEELEFVIAPRMTSVGFRVRGPEERTRRLYDKLTDYGYRITPQMRPSMFIRIIAHHHTEYSHIERLSETVRRCLT